MRDRVTAIDRAAIGKPAFLESGDEKVGVVRRTRDVGLGLGAHVGRERRRVVAEAKVGRDPQVERDGRHGFGAGDRRTRRPHEIAAAIEQAERAGGEALERDVLQRGWPEAAIGRRHLRRGVGCRLCR